MEHADVDLYTILKVSPRASTREIRRAYRRKVKQYHPDLNQTDSDTERKIRAINFAYEVLSHPAKRKEYDQSRIGREVSVREKNEQPSTPTTEPSDSELRDVFFSFFFIMLLGLVVVFSR